MAQLTPSRSEWSQYVQHALGRGLPAADAEDVVSRSYERACAAFDPERGSFGALMQRIVQRETVEWWRAQVRGRTAPRPQLEVVGAASPHPALEQAADNQRRLLEALSLDERRVFAAWALQKHCKGFDAKAAAARLDVTVAQYNNAKRRLKDRILRLADAWGLQPRDFFSVADDEGPRPEVRHAR